MKANRCRTGAKVRRGKFGAVVEEHRESVWSFIFKLTRDHHASDDLCQEVFVRALQTFHTLKQRERIKSWLFSIGYHVTVDWMRKNAADRRLVRGLQGRMPGEAAQPGPDAPAIRAEEARRAYRNVQVLWKRVRRLPPNYREVLRLRYRNRLPVARISERTGIPKGNVKVRLHRARRMLVRELEADPSFFQPAV
jgi:RNA polymerase sigma-70 factor (ECF subfamily)